MSAGMFDPGYTCCVEQGHYGHRARKATWLYACGLESLPSLKWGPSARRVRLDQGFHSAEERAFRSNRTLSPEMRRRKSEWLDAIAAAGPRPFKRLGATERAATPLPFRDLLLDIARSVTAREAAVAGGSPDVAEKSPAQECSICRGMHGLEITHACE